MNITDKDCNCGAQDDSEHRPHSDTCAVYNKSAEIVENEISVTHTIREDVGREFLTFDVPNGWDDVKKICRKVLEYDGRKFVFSAWNSDNLKCHFYRMLDGSTKTATIKKN